MTFLPWHCFQLLSQPHAYCRFPDYYTFIPCGNGSSLLCNALSTFSGLVPFKSRNLIIISLPCVCFCSLVDECLGVLLFMLVLISHSYRFLLVIMIGITLLKFYSHDSDALLLRFANHFSLHGAGNPKNQE
jgi:hypothetical protein